MTHATTLVAFFAVVGVGSTACNKDECHPGEDHCEGATAWSCVERGCEDCSGHVWSTRDCSDQGGTCVVPNGMLPVCSLSSEPDPACSGELANSTICVDEVLITCGADYRLSETSCGRPELCISGEDAGLQTAFCALSPEPAEICAGEMNTCAAAEGLRSCCTGSTDIYCRGGYLVAGPYSPCGCGSSTCDACTRGSDPLCFGYPCDVETGACERTWPCAAGYVWDPDPPIPLYCQVDQSAPSCSDGCGAYACVDELDRCATHCIDDLDCAADAVCTDGACT